MKISARIFVALVIISGLAVLGADLLHPSSANLIRLIAFLAITCLAARLRVKLPGITGTMSVNLPFILVAVAGMTAIEALSIAYLSTLIQCLPRRGQKLNLVRILFNCSTMALAVGATLFMYRSHAVATVVGSRSLLIAAAAAGYLLANTLPVAIVIALTEGKNALRTWVSIFQLSFPYFLASAGVAGVVLTLTAQVGWQLPLAVLPLMLGVFYSYKRYFSAAPLPAAVEGGAKKASASVAS